jgi:hypothetical protein
VRSEKRNSSGVGRGTYFCAFVSGTGDFAAIAIDSREIADGVPCDKACKIFPLDDFTIFACQGIGRGNGFSAGGIATKLFAQQQKPTSLSSLASEWAGEMLKCIENPSMTDPAVVKSMTPDDVAGGIFLGHDGRGNVSGVLAQIQELQPSAFTPVITPVPVDIVCRTFGHDDIQKQFEWPISHRARELLNSVKATPDQAENKGLELKMRVKAVIDWSEDSKVGGEVAVMILGRGAKWRWLSQPKFYSRRPRTGCLWTKFKRLMWVRFGAWINRYSP